MPVSDWRRTRLVSLALASGMSIRISIYSLHGSIDFWHNLAIQIYLGTLRDHLHFRFSGDSMYNGFLCLLQDLHLSALTPNFFKMFKVSSCNRSNVFAAKDTDLKFLSWASRGKLSTGCFQVIESLVNYCICSNDFRNFT